MDALSDVLRVSHLTGGVFLHADFFAPWCMVAQVGPEHCAPVLGPASHLIVFHYVVEGEFFLRVDGEGGESLTLETGEVALLPRNSLHLMGTDLTMPPVLGSDIIQPSKDIRLIGVPPMHYLVNWRMQVATQKLRDTSASLAQVAETVGYDSEAAFSRAFKKAFGAAPATWRRLNS
jgi:hypothetical protein